MRFADILGNERAKRELVKRVSSNTLAHAQIISGPVGNAKLPLALALAQLLNCAEPAANDSCGNCASCQKAAKYIHPDIHFSFPVISAKSGDKPVSTDFYPTWREALLANPYMDNQDWMQTISKENKQGNITKEECRSIISKLALKAFEGKNKILIMWLPEYLGKEGNSLLKLIEEPPENTYFILVSDNVDHILPTILSRTQLVKTQAFQAEDIKAYLTSKEYIQTENIDQVVFMADGSLSKALQLIDNADSNLSALFKDWMRNCYSRNVLETGKWCNQMATKGREELKHFFHNSLHILRECILLNLIDKYETRIPKDQFEFVKNFAKNMDTTSIEELYLLINDSIYEVERNVNSKIMLFDISLRIQDIFEGAKKRQEI